MLSVFAKNVAPHESIVNSSQIDGPLLIKPTEKHVKWKQPVSLNSIVLLLISSIDLLATWDPILGSFFVYFGSRKGFEVNSTFGRGSGGEKEGSGAHKERSWISNRPWGGACWGVGGACRSVGGCLPERRGVPAGASGGCLCVPGLP